ncbi:MAG: phosphate starvation-inducible protein PhoH, partial [Firmicutes bacterium]|nr:phosphate starvation-inducible protein PhoH [Bacillota bacterium]
MAQESNVKAEIQVKLPLRSAEEASTLCGLQDAHVKLIAKKFDVGIVVRDHHLVIHGIPVTVARVERLLRQLLELQRSGHTLSAQEVAYAAGLAQEGREGELAGIYSQTLTSTSRGKPVQPRTSGQKRYLEAI